MLTKLIGVKNSDATRINDKNCTTHQGVQDRLNHVLPFIREPAPNFSSDIISKKMNFSLATMHIKAISEPQILQIR